MKNLLCLFLIIYSLGTGCSSSGPRKTTQKLDAPAISQTANTASRYYFTIKTEMNSAIEFDGKETKNANVSEIGMMYELTTDTSRELKIKMTYDKLIVNIDKNGKGTTINAGNGKNSFDPVERILSNILGSSVQITLNTNRQIKSIEGTREISDKILASLDEYDQATKTTIEEQVSKLAGAEFIKTNIEESFRIIPDTGVRVGDSWQRTTAQTGNIPFQVASTYTLVALKDSIAEIEVESTVEKAAGVDSQNGLPNNAVAELDGNMKGVIQVNRQTGVVERSKSKTTIEGLLDVMGRQVPVSIEIKKEIAGKRIS